MDDFTRASLEADGFTGFVRLHDLDESGVPEKIGVYMVVRESARRPKFLEENPGGRFKKKNPTLSIPRLMSEWVDGCCILYIGMASGGTAGDKTLRVRLGQYRDFGRGKPVSHWGGRCIWQLADARKLLVCWKPTRGNPGAHETALLAEFKVRYGRLPFANLRS